jgi:hypothetical protein
MNRIIEEIEAEIQRLQAARALLAGEKGGQALEEERGHQGEDGRGAAGPLGADDGGKSADPLLEDGA